MRLEFFITKDKGEVTVRGGEFANATLRLNDTLDLVIGFTDAYGNVGELPAATPGNLVLKPFSQPLAAAFVSKQGWTLTGSGAARRYVFSFRVYSEQLRDAIIADPTALFALQVQWTIAGRPYLSENVQCTIQGSVILPGSLPPPVPTVGFPVGWSREVYGPAEEVATDERWVGNINHGGPIRAVRVSVEEWHDGLFVQLTHNGTNIFTAPVLINAQTVLFSIDDDPLKIALESVAAGARIEAQTEFDTGEYDTHPKGLQIEIEILASERSQLDTAPTQAFIWLVARLLAGTNVTRTVDNENETITLAASGGGGAVDWGDIGGTLADQTDLQAALELLAPLASPSFTGTPTAPTASGGTDNTQLATTAFVQAACAALVASSPSTLNTLNELAAALGNDANFATTMATALGLKAPLASPALTGTPTAPTAGSGNNTTQIATTAYVVAAIAGFVSSSRAISTDGLASGGGSLAADRTITVPVASQAEAEAGTDNTKAMTPLRTAEAIAAQAAGGGASLLHVTGMLQGHTTPLVPATSPVCTIDCSAWNGTGGVITISRNAETMLVTLDTTDPANGSTWLDTTSLSNPADFGPALNSALGAFSAEFTTAYDADTKIITLTAVLTGGAISLSVSISGTTGLATPTGTSGGDESPASGAIMSVELIPGVTGKIVYPLRVIVKSDLGVSVKLRDGNDNDLLPSKVTTGDTWEEWALGAATMAKFFQGTDEDTGLFFCFTDAATGGTATIYLIADQATAP